MHRDHVGFALFWLLLLLAPKVPVGLTGGAEGSAVSLGFVGLLAWHLACPGKCLHYPTVRVRDPFWWLLLFAFYAFVVSVISMQTVSVAYATQYLLYATLGVVLVTRYAPHLADPRDHKARSILFCIGVAYSAGMLVSLLTGPIYPHQTLATRRHWGGVTVPQGVGFAESQNMAAVVVLFLLMACIHLYTGRCWRKVGLLTLLLSALLATLSRSAALSFVVALFFVWFLSTAEPLLTRASIRRPVLVSTGLVAFVSGALLLGALVAVSAVDKSLLPALLHGFGLSDSAHRVSQDFDARLGLWTWGLAKWWSGGVVEVLFGGGFRSSMVVMADGAWKTAHNAYLTLMADFGVIGLLLFVMVLVSAASRFARDLVSGRAGRAESFGFATVTALCLHNMTGPYFYSPICLSLLVLAIGVGYSSRRT